MLQQAHADVREHASGLGGMLDALKGSSVPRVFTSIGQTSISRQVTALAQHPKWQLTSLVDKIFSRFREMRALGGWCSPCKLQYISSCMWRGCVSNDQHGDVCSSWAVYRQETNSSSGSWCRYPLLSGALPVSASPSYAVLCMPPCRRSEILMIFAHSHTRFRSIYCALSKRGATRCFLTGGQTMSA